MSEEEPLETSEDNLGNSVDGCSKSPDGKHFPDWDTVTPAVLEVRTDRKLYVIDANCAHCGLSGSRSVNPASFNWD